MSMEPDGARFYDEHKSDRGWANLVVKRERALGRLVILEVTTMDPALFSFLRALDRSPLQVQRPGTEGVTYRFVWASGYENGATVRVQNILQDA
jgi:hypothetical protein